MRIFHRIFASHLIIALAALFVAAGYTGFRVLSDSRQLMMQQLETYGRAAAELLRDRDWDSPEIQRLQSSFNAVDRQQEAHLWLVDRAGLTRMASASAAPDEEWSLQLSESAWDRLMAGEVVRLRERFGRQRPLQVPSVAVPVYRQGEVAGAILLSPQVSSSRWRGSPPFLSLLYGVLLAAAAVAPISWAVAKSIARPITLVSKAGRQIAQGDFSARVTWSSKDEVGDLAAGYNEMAAELGRLEAARKELMAHVSHELKGPLARVSGYIEAISDGIGGEAGRQEHFAIVRQEVGRLTRLVNDLLDASRLEAGRLKLHLIPCDLAPYLSRAVSVFEGAAQEQRVRLDLQIPPSLPIVTCEPERVEQVLVNLVDNALAHSPPQATVRVAAQVVGPHLAVTVTDEGPGLPPEERERIWERFHKANRARTLDKSGSGLGLTIVKQLIELQGGSVWVASSPGQGSTFGFHLPIATPEIEHLGGEDGA